MLTIAARELRSLFLSPLAWVVLAVVQAVLAYLFLAQLQRYVDLQPRLGALPGALGVTSFVVAPVLKVAGHILMFVMPLLTMRLVAGERRAGTMVLLLASPVSMSSIVLGKFLGVMGFAVFAVALVLTMPLSLLLGGSLDLGLLAAGALGLLLLLASYAAAGLFVSTLTSQPVIAAAGTMGGLVLLWVLDWTSGDRPASAVLEYLSITAHVDALLRGVFDTSDLAYYALFVGTFLALSVRRLDALRVSG